jgi:hypothetical protein
MQIVPLLTNFNSSINKLIIIKITAHAVETNCVSSHLRFEKNCEDVLASVSPESHNLPTCYGLYSTGPLSNWNEYELLVSELYLYCSTGFRKEQFSMVALFKTVGVANCQWISEVVWAAAALQTSSCVVEIQSLYIKSRHQGEGGTNFTFCFFGSRKWKRGTVRIYC